MRSTIANLNHSKDDLKIRNGVILFIKGNISRIIRKIRKRSGKNLKKRH